MGGKDFFGNGLSHVFNLFSIQFEHPRIILQGRFLKKLDPLRSRRAMQQQSKPLLLPSLVRRVKRKVLICAEQGGDIDASTLRQRGGYATEQGPPAHFPAGTYAGRGSFFLEMGEAAGKHFL
ncbi:MAG: hypothetical protein L3J03_10670 [Desulfobacterales bacterium]|nr:hypothetical protein [Desulfobacterales bacterium]